MVGYRSKLKLSVTNLIPIGFFEVPDFVWSIHQNSCYQLLFELLFPKTMKECHLTHLTLVLSKASQESMVVKNQFSFVNW